MRPHTNLFTQVDRTEDPDFFVRFMDEAQKPAAIQASKRLMMERSALTSGEAVVDSAAARGPTCSTSLSASVRLAGWLDWMRAKS
jgi:hypothetical protein